MRKRQPRRTPNQSNSYLDREDPMLKRFLAEVRNYPVLSQEELVPLIQQAQTGVQWARHKVGESNLRLILRIAREFQSINLSVNDLIQEGYLGLDMAIDRYNPEKGVPFSHFAAWWIKMKILKYIWWYQTTIRLPETQRTGINKLLKISEKFIAEHERIPSMEELLETSGLSEKMVANYYKLFNGGNMVGLKNIDDLEQEGRSPEDDNPTVEEQTDAALIKEGVFKCLETLSPRHQEFLKDYYGIGRPAVSVSELARRIGSTTENIRQKRARLVRYLRENCHQDLAPYADDEA